MSANTNIHNLIVTRDGEVDEEYHAAQDAQERRERLSQYGAELMSVMAHGAAVGASMVGRAMLELFDSAAQEGGGFLPRRD